MKNEAKGRDIFFGIVAVATLIVAIIGATLAYFSITTSSNEGAINATAAVVSIEYNDGQQVTTQANALIPAYFDVVKTIYERNVRDATVNKDQEGNVLAPESNLCVDNEGTGRQVCSAYRFSIYSEVERAISATLNNEENGFTYLSYALYDVTNRTWVELADSTYDLPLYSCSNANNESETPNLDDDCFKIEGTNKLYNTAINNGNTSAVNSLFGLDVDEQGLATSKTATIIGTQVYDLVLFIKESGDVQNMDQGKNYRGTIMVDVSTVGNGIISGCVDGDCWYNPSEETN